jgi:hypothetical protein
MIQLYNLIKKLKEVKSTSAKERKNMTINLKICEMQLEIIKRLKC